ncbi:MAG: hypothetical protein J4F35_23130 [Candidatus Latescibacteria bacterium]|nr:hypothetical protein [Candidatus Latescibacterota bacterium]
MPVVFRRGKVKGGEDRADEPTGKKHRQGRGHDHHYVDEQQLAAVQSGPWMDQLEQRVDQTSEKKQQEQGTDRAGPERHVRAAQKEDPIGVARGHEKREQAAEDQRFRRENSGRWGSQGLYPASGSKDADEDDRLLLSLLGEELAL